MDETNTILMKWQKRGLITSPSGESPEERSLHSWLTDTKEQIEATLDRLMPGSSPLWEAARYSLFNGGKRFRPFLALAVTESLGGKKEHALQPAAAIELIHTYSLIHDDLPCMDDDDTRRGKPTLHKVYNDGHAVLTGDFLLTYAFEVLSTAPHLTGEQKLALIELLAQKSGSNGMVGGQVLDLSWEGEKIPIEKLQVMYQQKTGALLEASVLFGGIIAGVDHPSLATFAKDLGLTFQIQDDILDAETKQSDERNQKSTYVTLLGLDKAKKEFHRSLEKTVSSLEKIPATTDLLNDLVSFLA